MKTLNSDTIHSADVVRLVLLVQDWFKNCGEGGEAQSFREEAMIQLADRIAAEIAK